MRTGRRDIKRTEQGSKHEMRVMSRCPWDKKEPIGLATYFK